MAESILECSICSDKLNEAMETNCCHTCYCKSCIDKWMQQKASCPSCRKSLTSKDIIPNIPVQRMINNLPATCPNIERGCKMQLTRGIVQEHLPHSCAYSMIECPSRCGKLVYRAFLNQHQQERCSRRLILCTKCFLSLPLNTLEDHESNSCPKATISCPHCLIRVVRNTLSSHLQNECFRYELNCPFSKFGCGFKGFRDDYNKHLVKDVDLHVGAVDEVLSLKDTDLRRLQKKLDVYKKKEKKPVVPKGQ